MMPLKKNAAKKKSEKKNKLNFDIDIKKKCVKYSFNKQWACICFLHGEVYNTLYSRMN